MYFDATDYIIYEPYRGLHLAYHAKRFCFSKKSRFQKIDIIDNEAYGRMLFLDNNVQHTEYDAHIFREALCGIAKGNGVARILVLGGGSGQTLLSLLESPQTKHVTLVEIDSLVIESCRRYIRGVDRAFADSRVEVVVGDAFKYLHSMNREFDAAIVDFTETPLATESNAKTLKQLYVDIRRKCNGRCSHYVGSAVDLSYNTRLRNTLYRMSKRYLTNTSYCYTFIPSFGAPHIIMHAGYKRKQPQKAGPTCNEVGREATRGNDLA